MTTKAKLKIDTGGQGDLFAHAANQERNDEPVLSTPVACKRRFNAPNPENITIGNTLLEEYLRTADQKLPFVLAEVLDEQDYTEFEQRYDCKGRPPYAPRNMVGIILYCIMQGASSLRSVEKSARLDLGCMWVSGGITPDHANIGRFINMHAETLTTSFFEAIVRTALKKTNSSINTLAGDGTVIEAACSHYKVYKEEALREMAAQAHQKLEQESDNQTLQKHAEQLDTALEEIDRRNAKKKTTKERQINPSEPDAMLQKAKRGRGFAMSYKPSVFANSQRIVVASGVNPGSEIDVIPDMLKQAKALGDSQFEELLLDAGYFADGVIKATLDEDVSLLCPEKTQSKRKGKAKYFSKDQFRYDAASDSYICPAGEQLIFLDKRNSEEKRHYSNAPCQTCLLKEQCTPSKRGRMVKRTHSDEMKEALREIMKHPQAREAFSKRQAMVEPVFGYLRQVQGLNRFRRKGLGGARVEFGLHLLAYNISRILAYFYHKNRLIWGYIREIIAIIASAMNDRQLIPDKMMTS